MAQHDYVIANGTGAAVRSDLNNALAAIVSQNSGATAPATTYAFQFWADTTTGLLKLRNSANNAWVTLFQLDGEWSTLPVENGTAAAPSIYFKDSGTDTGFYSPGTDQVAISTGGTGRLFINSSGSVGIGTSSPTQNLTVTDVVSVKSTPSGSSQVLFSDTDSDFAGRLFYNHTTDALQFFVNAAERARIDSSGRLGIGTTPVYKLDVYEASASGVDFRLRNTEGEFMIRVNDDAAIQQANTLIFRNSAEIERARIDSSGRWLLGTSSAISGGVIDSGSGSQNSLPSLQIAGTDWAQSSAILASYQNAGAVFPQISLNKSKSGTVGTIGAALASGDALGGITFSGSDGSKFVAGASIAAYTDAACGTNDLPGRLVFSTTADGASSPTERMRIDSGGVVRIGFTGAIASGQVFSLGVQNNTKAAAFHTTASSGYSAITCSRDNNGAVLEAYFQTTQVGSISVTSTTTTYNTSSDYRLKENVTAVADGITRLQQLKPSRFNFISEPGKTVDGFIAHEVQEIVPEAITGEKDAVDADGKPIYQGIDQSKLVPLLTAALQEAIGEIESLKARVAALESA